MKSLIIGANGMVGTALSRQLPNAIKTVRLPDPVPTRFELYADITKYETLFPVFANYRPEVVYLAAANTNVDKCESLETNVTNVRGPTQILRLCEQFGSKLVFFSSPYVFNGKSEWPYDIAEETAPINNYGMQKELVEQLILKSSLRFVIIRTVGVFGFDRERKNFVNRVSDTVNTGKKVYAPSDQVMNPISSSDLARIAVQLAKDEQGIFHVAGDACVSKYEFARTVADYFDHKNLIVPRTSEQMKQKAARPKMGCLDCHELEVLGIQIPNFYKSLYLFLDAEISS